MRNGVMTAVGAAGVLLVGTACLSFASADPAAKKIHSAAKPVAAHDKTPTALTHAEKVRIAEAAAVTRAVAIQEKLNRAIANAAHAQASKSDSERAKAASVALAKLESPQRHETVRPASMEIGLASIYCFRNGPTASGERSRPAVLTAAHKTLPFNTLVEVTNQNNGRSIVVRINDRGPFVAGRVIDLTPAGARALKFDGVTKVSLRVLNNRRDQNLVARAF